MDENEIVEMAKEAHRKLVTEVYVGHMGQLTPWTIELLKIFAKLVAAKESEACAKWYEDTGWFLDETDVADAIRARLQQ